MNFRDAILTTRITLTIFFGVGNLHLSLRRFPSQYIPVPCIPCINCVPLPWEGTTLVALDDQVGLRVWWVPWWVSSLVGFQTRCRNANPLQTQNFNTDTLPQKRTYFLKIDENRHSQKENSLPTIIFEHHVSFRDECRYQRTAFFPRSPLFQGRSFWASGRRGSPSHNVGHSKWTIACRYPPNDMLRTVPFTVDDPALGLAMHCG